MKNKAGKIIGFIVGMAGFLTWFKVFILDTIPREDEVPPGLVLLTSIFCGLVLGFAGNLLQNYLREQKSL